jgi:hypothetical protein
LNSALADPTLSARLLAAPSDAAAALLLEQQFATQPEATGAAAGLVLEGTNKPRGPVEAIGHRALRVATNIAAGQLRQSIQRNVSRFMGDAFTYARDRGTRERPGLIIQTVLEALRAKHDEADPLIVVSHSMGGAVVYDCLTHFDTSIQVDKWIAVGSQVGLFEDLKLLCSSNPELKHPSKVDKLANVNSWVNLFDPADVIAFRAEPMFHGVRDVHYHTGESFFTAHGAYFLQDEFYQEVKNLLSVG